MEEDEQGQLWVGLDNGGVEIFDGWIFQSVDTRLTGKNIRTIFKSSEGDMWVGSSNDGITVFGSDTTHLGHEQGLISNHIRSFCEDLEGKIWASTMGGGVEIFEDKKGFKSIHLDNGLSNLNSRAILCAKDGNVWVGTDNGIVVFKNYEPIKEYRRKSGLIGNRILALEEDHDGNVWVGTDKGLNMISPDTILTFGRTFGLKGRRVKALLVDAQNKLWIGTKNGLGSIQLNKTTRSALKESLQWYKEENGLSNDRIRCLYEDQSQALWIGTYFGGISKFFNNSFTLFTKEDGMVINVVNAVICNPRDSSLWLGTDGAGLNILGVKNFILNTDKGLSNNNITCLQLFNSGEALIGTEDGLNLVMNNQVLRVWDDYDPYFEGNKITHLEANDSHAIALTDKHKLIVLNVSDQFAYSNSITDQISKIVGPSAFALSYVEDKFWVANTHELLSFKIINRKVVQVDTWAVKNSDGIAGSEHFKLGYTSDNHLYSIQPDLGVSWLDTLKSYTDINFIVEGRGTGKVSSFWIGVNKGIVNLLIENGQIIEKNRFSIDEGFMGVQSFKNSAGLNFDGSIFVGTVKGLLKIEPKSYQGVKRVMSVHLKGILFEGDHMNLSKYTSSIENGIPIGLKLPHNKDNITFQISAIHLKNPKEVKYKYMLKGWDDEYKIKKAEESKGEGNIFHVDYDHIPAGTYEFIAYAKTPYGDWSETPLRIQIEITPIWWKNPYYIGGSLIILIGLIVFMIVYRTRSLVKEKEKLEAIVLERTKDLSSEKRKSDELLLNILPVEIAAELKTSGTAKTKSYKQASVLFTDFVGFTHLSTELKAVELVEKLDEIFVAFDEVMERNSLEKIKTIGDAYMCASGIPKRNSFQERNIVLGGLQLVEVMSIFNKKQRRIGKPEWRVRVGIHTGELIAGVVGKKKFAYDIWGDTVNLASRMESSGAAGKVNISERTYEIVEPYFDFEKRGKIAAKNAGELEMYFVTGIKENLRSSENILRPNSVMFL